MARLILICLSLLACDLAADPVLVDAAPDASPPEDSGPLDAAPDAAAPSCPTAMEALAAACCSDDPAHPEGDAANLGAVDWTDCVTGAAQTLDCIETAGVPPVGEEAALPEVSFEGAPEEDPSCSAAAAQAAEACDDPTLAEAVDCGLDDSAVDAWVSCDQLRAWADAVSCEPVDLVRWSAFEPRARERLYEALATPPQVRVSEPPPEDTWEEGTPIPPPGADLERPEDGNTLLDALRLELPGNFLRFQLSEAVLRTLIGDADELPGFDCDAEALSCTINPLTVFDLSAALTQEGSFVVEVNPITVDGLDGWRLENISWTPDLDDYAELTVSWDGHVDLLPEALAGFDLGAPTRLSLLPMHHPEDQLDGNTYPLAPIAPPARQHSELHRALLLMPVEEATCNALNQPPAYVTFRQSVKCRCPGGGAPGYCVVDGYPRQEMREDVRAFLAQSEDAHAVYCAEPFEFELRPYRSLGADEDLSNFGQEAPLHQLIANVGLDMPAEWITEDLRSFGCAGRLSARLRRGPQRVDDFGAYRMKTGRATQSAAGIELLTRVELGGVRVAIVPGLVNFTFELGVRIEEWVKKKFGRVIGWILKWVLKVTTGLLNIAAQVELPPPGILNTAYVKLAPIDLTVQGALLHHMPADAPGSLSVGLRRVATSAPQLDPGDGWGFDVTFDAPACRSITGSGNLLQKFKSLLACPVEVLLGVAGMITQPLQSFLATQLLEITLQVTDQVNEALVDTTVQVFDQLEDSNVVAALLNNATATLFFEPGYLFQAGDPEAAMLDALPPGLAHACSLAPRPELACTLAHLMTGAGMVQADFGLSLLRVGAKTHVRSMQDFAALEGGSHDWPPVRHCVVGDQPPGAPPFDEADRARTQDLLEVDVGAQGDRPLDWRAQCAVFVDFSPRATGQVMTPALAYRVGLWVSRRTQRLLNDVFTCRNSAECHPALPFIRGRAEVAFCSVVGDIWAHPLNAQVPYTNLLRLLTDPAADPAVIEATRLIWDRVRSTLGIEVPDNSFDTLVDLANGCRERITAAGFSMPPESLPADAFAE